MLVNPARALRKIDRAISIGTQDIGYRQTYAYGITTIIQRRNLLPSPEPAKNTIPFQNGLLDVTLRLLVNATSNCAHDWVLPHKYTPVADCPTIKLWLLRSTGDPEAVELLRAWIAALILGVKLQKILLLTGPGGTGKGAFQRLIEATIGHKNIAVTNLRDLEENRFETAKLVGKRLAMINEAGRHGGSVDNLKAITGGDYLSIERKHEQQTGGFYFDGLVLMASNEQLQTKDRTSGLERRRVTVEFKNRVTTAEKMEWERLGSEECVLHTEVPGLINWCLELTREQILERFEVLPASVMAANLLGMAAGNSVADWMIENCVPEAGVFTQVGKKHEIRDREDSSIHYKREAGTDAWLYPNYLAWSRQTGRDYPVSLRVFGEVIVDIAEKLGHPVSKTQQPSKNVAVINGLRLRGDSDFPYSWASTEEVGHSMGAVGAVGYVGYAGDVVWGQNLDGARGPGDVGHKQEFIINATFATVKNIHGHEPDAQAKNTQAKNTQSTHVAHVVHNLAVMSHFPHIQTLSTPQIPHAYPTAMEDTPRHTTHQVGLVAYMDRDHPSLREAHGAASTTPVTVVIESVPPTTLVAGVVSIATVVTPTNLLDTPVVVAKTCGICRNFLRSGYYPQRGQCAAGQLKVGDPWLQADASRECSDWTVLDRLIRNVSSEVASSRFDDGYHLGTGGMH